MIYFNQRYPLMLLTNTSASSFIIRLTKTYSIASAKFRDMWVASRFLLEISVSQSPPGIENLKPQKLWQWAVHEKVLLILLLIPTEGITDPVQYLLKYGMTITEDWLKYLFLETELMNQLSFSTSHHSH